LTSITEAGHAKDRVQGKPSNNNTNNNHNNNNNNNHNNNNNNHEKWAALGSC